MKKKILLILLLLILLIFGGLAVYQLKFKSSIEDDIQKIRTIKCYSTDVNYVFKNSRGQFKEAGKQYYNDKYGMKLVLGEKEQIYKDDKIVIKNGDNKKYEVDSSYDNFYRYTFINELNEFLIPSDNIKYSYDTFEGKKCIVIEFNSLNGNENMQKEVLLIDAKKLIPVQINILNGKGEDKVTVTFKNFNTSGTVQKELFD